MLTSDSILHISGLILTILVSVSLLNYSTKLIVGNGKVRKSTNQIYDPDFGRNFSQICIFTKNPFSTLYENTPCHNKTLPQWYNPWLHDFLWRGFRNELVTRKQEEMKQVEMEKEENETITATMTSDEPITNTESPHPEKKFVENQKAKEGPSELLYSILVGLLIMSAMGACWEVFKDKLKRNDVAAAKLQERQCTLADFTINRHLRRESQQQAAGHLTRQASFELTAKVTQTLVHQSSLDRAFPNISSEAMKTKELRRNSVPSYLITNLQPNDKASNRNINRIIVPGESLGEENSPDIRKKFRHFIRRH